MSRLQTSSSLLLAAFLLLSAESSTGLTMPLQSASVRWVRTTLTATDGVTVAELFQTEDLPGVQLTGFAVVEPVSLLQADLRFTMEVVTPVVLETTIGLPAIPVTLEFTEIMWEFPAPADPPLVVTIGGPPEQTSASFLPSAVSTINGTLTVGTSSLPFSIGSTCEAPPAPFCVSSASVLVDSTAVTVFDGQGVPTGQSTHAASLQSIGSIDGIEYQLGLTGIRFLEVVYAPEPSTALLRASALVVLAALAVGRGRKAP